MKIAVKSITKEFESIMVFDVRIVTALNIIG